MIARYDRETERFVDEIDVSRVGPEALAVLAGAGAAELDEDVPLTGDQVRKVAAELGVDIDGDAYACFLEAG